MSKEVNFSHRVRLMCVLGIAGMVLSLWIGSAWTTSANDGAKVRRDPLKGNPLHASLVSIAAGGWLFPGEYESHQAMWMLWPVFENKAGFPSTEVVSDMIHAMHGRVHVNLAVQDDDDELFSGPSSHYRLGSTAVLFNSTAVDPTFVLDQAGQDPGVFTFTRTGGNLAAALTVRFSRGGTAANNSDYSNIGFSVVIPANQSSATVTITPIDDTVVEVPETVVLTINASTNYVIGTPPTATVTIADND